MGQADRGGRGQTEGEEAEERGGRGQAGRGTEGGEETGRQRGRGQRDRQRGDRQTEDRHFDVNVPFLMALFADEFHHQISVVIPPIDQSNKS